MSWRLEPGSDLVIEMHLMPGAVYEKVQASVGLFFTSEAPSNSPYMLRLGRQDIDIPAGQREYVSEDSYTLPVDVAVLGVQPHAHYLAREIRGSGEASRRHDEAAHLHQRLGLSLAGHVRAHDAVAPPERDGALDAIHLR